MFYNTIFQQDSTFWSYMLVLIDTIFCQLVCGKLWSTGWQWHYPFYI